MINPTKRSVFDVRNVNYIGTPSGFLYSDKELENITVYDLVNEKKDTDISNFNNCYTVFASDTSINVENRYIGYFYNGQYFNID